MSHFAGTASFYSEFRPGYPEELLKARREGRQDEYWQDNDGYL